MSFSEDIEKFVKKANNNINAVVAMTVLSVGKSLVMKSPVGNPSLWKNSPPPGYVGGRFRANWQYGEGSINAKTDFGIDASGIASLSRIPAAAKAGHIHYVTNSLPYATRLEYGFSSQAPSGMVALTVAEFTSYVADAVRGVK